MALKLKKGMKVFYPGHGAGWVVQKKEIEFDGKKEPYFEFKFVNNHITVSAPINKTEELKIRKVHSTKTLKNTLKKIKKKSRIKPSKSNYNKFIKNIKILDETGDLEDCIKVLRQCRYIQYKRKKEGQAVPVQVRKYIHTATEYLVSELSVSGDIEYDKSAKLFTKLTGIQLDT